MNSQSSIQPRSNDPSSLSEYNLFKGKKGLWSKLRNSNKKQSHIIEVEQE